MVTRASVKTLRLIISINLPLIVSLHSRVIFSIIYFPCTKGSEPFKLHISGNITSALLPMFLTGYIQVAS